MTYFMYLTRLFYKMTLKFYCIIDQLAVLFYTEVDMKTFRSGLTGEHSAYFNTLILILIIMLSKEQVRWAIGKVFNS